MKPPKGLKPRSREESTRKVWFTYYSNRIERALHPNALEGLFKDISNNSVLYPRDKELLSGYARARASDLSP